MPITKYNAALVRLWAQGAVKHTISKYYNKFSDTSDYSFHC